MQFFLQKDAELLEYIQGYSGDLSKLDYRKVYDRSASLNKNLRLCWWIILFVCVGSFVCLFALISEVFCAFRVADSETGMEMALELCKQEVVNNFPIANWNWNRIKTNWKWKWLFLVDKFLDTQTWTFHLDRLICVSSCWKTLRTTKLPQRWGDLLQSDPGNVMNLQIFF